jgi:ABC-type sugar transport system substrate-binding protein
MPLQVFSGGFHLIMETMKRICRSSSLLFFLIGLSLVCGCSPGSSYKYKIGVSQCVGGSWRDKVNNEMLSAQHLYDTDVKVIIKNADNRTDVQQRQIDSWANASTARWETPD